MQLTGPGSSLSKVAYPPIAPDTARFYSPPPEEESFADTLHKLWRRRTLIIATLVVFAIVGVVVAKMLPTYYSGEARVLIGVPPLRVLNIQSILTEADPDADRIQNEAYVVASRDTAAAVVRKMNLRAQPEFNPWLPPDNPSLWQQFTGLFDRNWGALEPVRELFANDTGSAATSAEIERTIVDILLSRTDVSQLGRSHVLSIKVRSADAERAAELANAFAETYLNGQRAEKVQASEDADQFLMERIDQLREQVSTSDEAVEAFRRKFGLYKGATAGVASQQLTELNTQLMAAQTAKAEAESRLAEAQTLGGRVLDTASVPEVLRSPLIQGLKQQAAEAEQRLADATQRLGARHPQRRGIQAEVGNLRGKIGAEVSRTVESLRREARSATIRYEELRRSFEELKTTMGGVNEQQVKLDALEREAAVNHHLLEQMLGRAKEMIGQQQLQRANAKLISAAAQPNFPAFPPKPIIAFLSVLAGGLIACAWVLLRDSLDTTFRQSTQVEAATGLPVLALVPQIEDRMGPLQYILRRPTSAYVESLRKLQTTLELSEPSYSPKLIMFCSAIPDEGKSVLVASLGRVLATHGRRVLLIDCDWRRPALHRLFRLPNEGGLGAMLDDEADASDRLIHSDHLSGVDVMVAGNVTPSGVRVLTSDRFRTVLQGLAERYDMILLDTPPVLVGAEVLAISRMVEKVTFVARWGSTKRQVAFAALKQLLEAGADVAGIVLSRVDAKAFAKYGDMPMYYNYNRPALAQLR